MSKTVAVIGASRDRRKFGNRAVRAYQNAGYTVIPINPHEEDVEGLKTYRSVLDVPGPIDTALFYVPPDIGEQVIGEVARKQIPEVWLNPGADSDALIEKARALNVPGGLGTSADFAEALLDDARVAVTPGEAFDAPGFVRISYATSLDLLREGCQRLVQFAARRAPVAQPTH